MLYIYIYIYDILIIMVITREGLVELMASLLLHSSLVHSYLKYASGLFSLLVDFRERNQRPVTTRYNANIVF